MMSKVLFSLLFVMLLAVLFLHLRNKISRKLLAEKTR